MDGAFGIHIEDLDAFIYQLFSDVAIEKTMWMIPAYYKHHVQDKSGSKSDTF